MTLDQMFDLERNRSISVGRPFVAARSDAHKSAHKRASGVAKSSAGKTVFEMLCLGANKRVKKFHGRTVTGRQIQAAAAKAAKGNRKLVRT